MLLSSPDEACSDTLAIERLRRWHPARVVVFLAAGKVPGLGVTALLAGRRWSVIEAA
jgi:hypothetical protein